jgi:DNA-directed RNA polymerase alpha subunit
LVGVDASVANAIRRIVIAEVSSNSRSLVRVECFVQILTFSLVSSLI